MRKIIIAVLVFICLLGLTACDPGVRNLDRDELLANTVKIELFNYENEKPDLLRLAGKKKPSFDFSKAVLIGELEEAHFEAVINEVAECDYFVFGKALNEPMGKTLVLYQNNGDMIVLFGCLYKNEKGRNFYYGDCCVFDENGVFVDHIGDVGHLFTEELESRYFNSVS